MPAIAALTTFTANTQAKAAEVNANFSSIRTAVNTYGAFVDLTATISGVWTFSTAPVFSSAQTFAQAVTITTGGLTISAGGFTVTGNSSVAGTLTATTFSGSGASLTNLPASQLVGAYGAADGSAITALNGSNIASGTVAAARLPTTYSSLTLGNIGVGIAGANVIQATSGSIVEVREARLLGSTTTSSGPVLDMRASASYFLTDPSGGGAPTWWLGNNGVGSNSTPQGGPNGYTTYTANAARFLKVDFEGTEFFIRMERWAA